MANRRMISKRISISRKLAKVSQFSALLFTWLIPHCDDGGNMAADPETIKALVVPARPETVTDVEESIQEMTDIQLITVYEVNNEKYLHINKWEEHQTLRFDRTSFEYPAYQMATSWQPPGNPREDKLREEKIYVLTKFKEFWEVYPNKVSKKKAQDSFLRIKLTPELYEKIMSSLRSYCQSDGWTRDGGRFIPHPTTWLNQERWNDVVPVAKVVKEKPVIPGYAKSWKK